MALAGKKGKKRLLLVETLLALALALLTGFAMEEIPPDVPDTIVQDVVQHQQEIYTVVLPPQTVYTRDLSLPKGQERVQEAGQSGELRCTAEVTYVNGQECSRIVTDRELLREPIDRVVAVGERERPKTEIRDGLISLPDGKQLRYTNAVVIHASAYPSSIREMTLSDGSVLRIGTASADPGLIPPGTRLFIASADGSYGIAIAADGMQGDRVELYLPPEECMAFGEQTCIAYFLA